MKRSLVTMIGWVVYVLVLTAAAVIIISNAPAQSNHGIQVYSTHGNVEEWISPDGVHYWFYKSDRTMGMSPRFDGHGELVIDEPGGKREESEE